MDVHRSVVSGQFMSPRMSSRITTSRCLQWHGFRAGMSQKNDLQPMPRAIKCNKDWDSSFSMHCCAIQNVTLNMTSIQIVVSTVQVNVHSK